MAIDLKLIDQQLADYKKPEDVIGENGLLKQLTKALMNELSVIARGDRHGLLPSQTASPA